MSATDLVNHLRAEVEHPRARVQLLEQVARLNGKTVRYVLSGDDATPGPGTVSTPLLAGQQLLLQQVQASYPLPYAPPDQVEAYDEILPGTFDRAKPVVRGGNVAQLGKRCVHALTQRVDAPCNLTDMALDDQSNPRNKLFASC